MGARGNAAGASSSAQQGHATPHTVSYPTVNPVGAASFSADPVVASAESYAQEVAVREYVQQAGFPDPQKLADHLLEEGYTDVEELKTLSADEVRSL